MFANVVVVVLIVVAVHEGLVVVDKSFSDTITVVDHASHPCLDLAFTLPNPLLDLAWPCLDLAMNLS